MEEYKKSYEKIIQGNGGNFLTFKGSFTINFRKLTFLIYQASINLLQDLFIILDINTKSD